MRHVCASSAPVPPRFADVEHHKHIFDRSVPSVTGFFGQHRSGDTGEGRVFIARKHERSLDGVAAFDDIFIHSCTLCAGPQWVKQAHIQEAEMFQIQDRFTIRMPDDFHAHLRQGGRLPAYARACGQFGRVLHMPNHAPVVRPARLEAIGRIGGARQLPEMNALSRFFTFKILPGCGAESRPCPRGVVPQVQTLRLHDQCQPMSPLFDESKNLERDGARGLVLCIHGRRPMSRCSIASGLPAQVEHLLVRQPAARGAEHLSDTRERAFRRNRPKICATITAHHLCSPSTT